MIDVWRGEVKSERNLVLFGAYKAFFPQLIAGPIVRYRDVERDFHHPDLNADIFAAEVGRFIVGLCKKVLIADSVAGVADASFALAGADQTLRLRGSERLPIRSRSISTFLAIRTWRSASL